MHGVPFVRDGQWVVDLREAGFGRIVLGPAHWPLERAVAEMVRRMTVGSPGRQNVAPTLSPTLGRVFEALLADRDAGKPPFDTPAGRKGWISEQKKLAQWHGRRVSEFEPGAQLRSDLAEEIRDALRAEVGPKRTRNCLSTLWQALAYAHRDGWLQRMPVKPSYLRVGEKLNKDFRRVWWVEIDARRLRDGIFVGARHVEQTAAAAREHGCASVEEYIAKRKLFVSFSFYTGMRLADLESLDDCFVSMLTGQFLRRGQKTSIPEKPFPMPAQLWADVEELLMLLGRPFRSGEKITGGRWPNLTRTWRHAAQRLGLGPVTPSPRVFRRSCARELAMRGWTREATADYLGHTSTEMVEEVYRDPFIPIDPGPPRPWDGPLPESRPGNPHGKLLGFPARAKK